jgi:hypothetical protein
LSVVTEAKLRALELRLREGQLVDRAAVVDRVLGYMRRARDQWLAWPSRIGAELADALGADRVLVTTLLEDQVAAQLEALAADVFDLPAGPTRVRGSDSRSARWHSPANSFSPN